MINKSSYYDIICELEKVKELFASLMVNFQRLNMLERKLLISMLKGDFESFIIIFLITEFIME